MKIEIYLKSVIFFEKLGGLKTTVNAKRSYTNYILPYKSSPIPKPKAPIINMENDIQEVSSTKRKSSESEYIFRTGMIPPSRQMFYQVFFLRHHV